MQTKTPNPSLPKRQHHSTLPINMTMCNLLRIIFLFFPKTTTIVLFIYPKLQERGNRKRLYLRLAGTQILLDQGIALAQFLNFFCCRWNLNPHLQPKEGLKTLSSVVNLMHIQYSTLHHSTNTLQANHSQSQLEPKQNRAQQQVSHLKKV